MRTDDDLALATAEISRHLTALRAEFEAVKRELKYSPDQPRVPAGSGRESGQWTDGSGVGGGDAVREGAGEHERVFRNTEGRTQVAQGPVGPLIQRLAPALGRLLTMTPVDRMTAALAASAAAAQSGQVAIHWMRAREGEVTREGELIGSRVLSREEARAACPNLDTVQRLLDRYDQEVRAERPNVSPQAHGTEVHLRVANEIRENSRRYPGLRAELTLPSPASLKGIRRADVFDTQTGGPLACAYDMKTGAEGWSTREMIETMRRAPNGFPRRHRAGGLFAVVEVRPSWRQRRR